MTDELVLRHWMPAAADNRINQCYPPQSSLPPISIQFNCQVIRRVGQRPLKYSLNKLIWRLIEMIDYIVKNHIRRSVDSTIFANYPDIS